MIRATTRRAEIIQNTAAAALTQIPAWLMHSSASLAHAHQGARAVTRISVSCLTFSVSSLARCFASAVTSPTAKDEEGRRDERGRIGRVQDEAGRSLAAGGRGGGGRRLAGE